MADVDDLFGGDAAHAPKPRTPVVVGIATGGVVVAAVGLLCSVIPGLAMVAFAWNVAEADWARVTSGYYAPEQRTRALIGRVFSLVMLGVGFILLVAQFALLWNGVYHALWGAFAAMFVAALPGGPPP